MRQRQPRPQPRSRHAVGAAVSQTLPPHRTQHDFTGPPEQAPEGSPARTRMDRRRTPTSPWPGSRPCSDRDGPGTGCSVGRRSKHTPGEPGNARHTGPVMKGRTLREEKAQDDGGQDKAGHPREAPGVGRASPRQAERRDSAPAGHGGGAPGTQESPRKLERRLQGKPEGGDSMNREDRPTGALITLAEMFAAQSTLSVDEPGGNTPPAPPHSCSAGPGSSSTGSPRQRPRRAASPSCASGTAARRWSWSGRTGPPW